MLGILACWPDAAGAAGGRCGSGGAREAGGGKVGVNPNNGGPLYAERVHNRLGRELQELRERKGLSRSALARSSGVSRDEIIEIEEGRVNPLTITLCQLAFGMGLTLGELVEELGE